MKKQGIWPIFSLHFIADVYKTLFIGYDSEISTVQVKDKNSTVCPLIYIDIVYMSNLSTIKLLYSRACVPNVGVHIF